MKKLLEDERLERLNPEEMKKGIRMIIDNTGFPCSYNSTPKAYVQNLTDLQAF